MLQVSRGNRGALWIAVLILLAAGCRAGLAQDRSAQESSAARAAQTTQSQEAPAETSQSNEAPEQASPAQPAGRGSREAEKGGGGMFVFRTEVQEVILQATVADEHHRQVTTLNRDDFRVFEDGKPQRITSFRKEDIPVALGIVIDNSGSMRDKRPSVNTAALNLVRASNPQDQVCVVNFNNEFYLDQDYTGDVALLRDALERIESRGGTALYDALVATSDHLMKTAKLQKKAILVVTDGEDTASRDSLEQAVRAIAVDGGPAVYSIGILGHEKEKKARRALRILAEQTGGVAYFPADAGEVEAISQEVAHDIRTQYAIGYRPSTPKLDGGFRQVTVKASASGFKGLSVRTRSGYYATSGQTASANQ
jgi:Ca-activated chloride channel homolog